MTTKKITIFSNHINENSDGSYTIPNLAVNNVDNFQLRWALIAPSFNTVSAYRGNNVLKITIVAPTTYTIPDGTYDIAQLCAQIQTQLQAVDPNFTCTYVATTQLVTITDTVNFTIDKTVSTVMPILGFTQAQTLTGAATYTGVNAYNPQDLAVVNLHIDNLKYYVDSSTFTNLPDYILTIPVTKNLDSFIEYKPTIPELFRFKNGNIVLSNTRLYFTFPEGKIIQFRGGHWYLRFDFDAVAPPKSKFEFSLDLP